MSDEHTIIKLAKKVENLYKNDIIKKVEIASKEIEKIFEKTFNIYDKKYNLVYSNSVHKDKKIYHFVYRVKKSESLYEKLFRKNIIFDLIKITNNNMLKEKILNFDDNIGFRIVCDLEEDVSNVYNLIKENEDQFNYINFENISSQPVKMKNGHNIYKINCMFKKKYPFELQLKSKLDSAWADMEHDLYYKDNRIDVVKEINKISFSHIADMLRQIDEYMSKLRKMNQDSIDIKSLTLLSELEKRYESDLKSSISNDFTFDFGSLSKQLTFMLKNSTNQQNWGISGLKRIIINFLDNPQKRHTSWEIIILEAIYYDLIADDILRFYNYNLEFILDFLNISIEKENLKYFIEYFYQNILIKNASGDDLIKLERFKNLEILANNINEVILDNFDNFDDFDDNDDNKYKNIIIEYFGSKLFNFAFSDDFEEAIEDQKIIDTISKIKNNLITKSEKDIKLKNILIKSGINQ